MAKLYRVESYHGGKVVVSFRSDTRREGTMLSCSGGTPSAESGQPDLYMYPDEEQEYMKQATAAVYRMVYPNT